MYKRTLYLFLVLLIVNSFDFCRSQDLYITNDLLKRKDDISLHQGRLNVYQSPQIDTLINRYILYNLKLGGLEGFRIQIYSSSNVNAREESGKVEAEFMNKFPDIRSSTTFERPGYYKIRVGDYRTRMEGTKDLLMIRRIYPDAYLVPDKINFPDLNLK
jgi:hypothetical protein